MPELVSFSKKVKSDIFQQVQNELGLKNVHQVPVLKKVILSVGVGDAVSNARLMEEALTLLTAIAGQKPVVTRAKKSVAGFKIREDMPIGLKVTLRGARMYDFLAKLTGVAMPRIRDFRGLSDKGFDGKGNYNLGLQDQLVFPEVDYDSVTRLRGMNITLVTSAETDQHAKVLLYRLGFPFNSMFKAEEKTA